MTTKINNENAESGLLPYPVIIAATKGDPEAMKIVVQHYESYIASLSMRKLREMCIRDSDITMEKAKQYANDYPANTIDYAMCEAEEVAVIQTLLL